MSNKLLSLAAVAAGLFFVGLAFFYWMTPAGSLPAYFPGFEVGVQTVHVKHGIAALLLGLAAFAYAWFQSGKKPS